MYSQVQVQLCHYYTAPPPPPPPPPPLFCMPLLLPSNFLSFKSSLYLITRLMVSEKKAVLVCYLLIVFSALLERMNIISRPKIGYIKYSVDECSPLIYSFDILLESDRIVKIR